MAKGSDFERQLCVQISKWWTQDLAEPRTDCFWRTAGSGGRATTRAKKSLATRNSHGDICALDDVGAPLLQVLALELKRGYSKANLHDVIDKSSKAKQQVWEEWFAQAEKSRVGSNALYWAVIHKRDYREALFVTQKSFFNRLSTRVYANLALRAPLATFYLDEMQLAATHFDAFLHAVKPKDILALLCQGIDNSRQATA